MKKGLKFIIALLIAGSLGIWFLPVMETAVKSVSVADVFKIGMGYYDRNSMLTELYAFIQSRIESYAWLIAGAAGFVVVEAILTAVLRKRAAYIMGIIVSLINAGAFLALFFVLEDRFAELEHLFTMYIGDNLIELSYLELFAWLAVYALVLILSVIGLILWRKPRETNEEEIYLEQIQRAEAERARRHSAQNRPRRDPVRHQPSPAPRQAGRQEQNQSGNYSQPDGFQKEKPSAWAPPEEKETALPVEQSMADTAAENEFSGAVAGESGLYEGKVYQLSDKKEVFFYIKEDRAVLSPYEEDGAAAGIYYIKEYEEYCAEPFEKGVLFLESGQPLGKGRQYYLPRGTKIYIAGKQNLFTLM